MCSAIIILTVASCLLLFVEMLWCDAKSSLRLTLLWCLHAVICGFSWRLSHSDLITWDSSRVCWKWSSGHMMPLCRKTKKNRRKLTEWVICWLFVIKFVYWDMLNAITGVCSQLTVGSVQQGGGGKVVWPWECFVASLVSQMLNWSPICGNKFSCIPGTTWLWICSQWMNDLSDHIW